MPRWGCIITLVIIQNSVALLADDGTNADRAQLPVVPHLSCVHKAHAVLVLFIN